MSCVSRELTYDLGKKEDKLHLLNGLMKIVMNIDEVIKVIRGTENDADVVPNLAAAFELTMKQAEYIAEIKLRNINREYIYGRIDENKNLTKEIDEIKSVLRDELKLKALIIEQLQQVKKKYGKPRKTQIINAEEFVKPTKDIFFENYNCRLLFTKGGYFKKLSVQGMRSNEEQKMKEGDAVIYIEDTDNTGDVLFFTDRGQIFRLRVADFDISKPSSLGEYMGTKLSLGEDEHVVGCKMIHDMNPEHHMVYIFENGKGARIKLSAYEAKTKRKKISGAYNTDSKLVGAVYEGDKPVQIFIRSDAGRAMLIKSDLIQEKATRTAAGVQVMQLPKKGVKVEFVTDRIADVGQDAAKCKKNTIPSTGTSIHQLTFKF